MNEPQVMREIGRRLSPSNCPAQTEYEIAIKAHEVEEAAATVVDILFFSHLRRVSVEQRKAAIFILNEALNQI